MPGSDKPTEPPTVKYGFTADSIEMPIRLLSRDDITPLAKVVYLAIRYHAAESGGYLAATIDRATLLKDSGLPKTTFARGLAELERTKWVIVLRPNEDEKIVTINGQEVPVRVNRVVEEENPVAPKGHRFVWASLYILRPA